MSGDELRDESEPQAQRSTSPTYPHEAKSGCVSEAAAARAEALCRGCLGALQRETLRNWAQAWRCMQPHGEPHGVTWRFRSKSFPRALPWKGIWFL